MIGYSNQLADVVIVANTIAITNRYAEWVSSSVSASRPTASGWGSVDGSSI